jgi:succinate dehydrogenase hydrophobic anchor subunit
MRGKSLGDMENHAFFVLFIAFILIVFWHAIWELLTEFTEYIHRQYNIPKWKLYVVSLIGVMLIIVICPQILEKI